MHAEDQSTRPPRTLAGRAVAQIQEMILAERFKPGDRLRIEELADILEMSPMPIREAIQRLQSLGFVEHSPHRGARVRELSIDDLMDLYSVRIPLEVLAVRRAAAVFTDEDAQRAKRALAAYDASYRDNDTVGAREAHLQFHLSIYEATGSHWLMRLIRPLCENGERYRLAALFARGSLDARRREHQEILDACIAHDADAAATALHRHLYGTVRLLAPDLEIDLDAAPVPHPETVLEQYLTERRERGTSE
jgi:DNA-binding GntR family transcriptional regulator